MHVHLNQRVVTDAAETVNFARLDDQDISRARLELLTIDDPGPRPSLMNWTSS
jgi:hypothetical protein